VFVRVVSGRPHQKSTWVSVWAKAHSVEEEAVVVVGDLRVDEKLRPQ
jgi:hypothetical protein